MAAAVPPRGLLAQHGQPPVYTYHTPNMQSFSAGPSFHAAAPANYARPPATLTRPHGGSVNLRAVVQEQQCAEDCDAEECGDDERPPDEDNLVCGIDRRPWMPVGLFVSTVLGALHMIFVIFPTVAELGDTYFLVRGFFIALYSITVPSILYGALSDPGQMPVQDSAVAMHGLPAGGEELVEEAIGELPRRAHKTWLYRRPIRRYDHYCKWLTNSIGLLNHRSFFAMCLGLSAIGVFGALLDTVLVFVKASGSNQWLMAAVIALHLTYSAILAAFVVPIALLHVGFVARNELAHEWKQHDYYEVWDVEKGKFVHVHSLDVDEHNARFEEFQYSSKLNPWDKGCITNCVAFWCTPRGSNQSGEF